jgi:hypothetical protein
MRAGFTIALVAGALLVASLPAAAQSPRQDVVWARNALGASITLDGHLTHFGSKSVHFLLAQLADFGIFGYAGSCAEPLGLASR